MISVITPTHNTPPETLARTFASLKKQTYTDWEWVVWDDSTNDSVWQQLWGFCSDERYRIRPYRAMTYNGSIGSVKRNAFMVATGDILVELDHDDELTPNALQVISDTFQQERVGFVFSDWCEINNDGVSCRYPEGWAFGYGSDYWNDEYGVWVMRSPEINRTTLSHIVSVPNHVRAWDVACYRDLGGHNPEMPVADDYELLVRTFLTCEWAHIPEMLYLQHIGGHTAQRQQNSLIQELVQQVSERYSGALDEYFGTFKGINDE